MAAQGARVGDAEVWPAQEWRAVVQAFESAVRPRRWLLGCTGGTDPVLDWLNRHIRVHAFTFMALEVYEYNRLDIYSFGICVLSSRRYIERRLRS